MAKVVLINTNSYRPGVNEIGDIVSIHDDDVELSGLGYENVQVIIVQNITRSQIRAKLKENWPERMIAGLDRYWQKPSDGLWYKIQNRPKYGFSVKDLSQQNLAKLQQGNVTTEEKLTIFGSIPAKFTPLAENNSVICAFVGIFDGVNVVESINIIIG